MDSTIPETQAETNPLNELLTTSDTVGPLIQYILLWVTFGYSNLSTCTSPK